MIAYDVVAKVYDLFLDEFDYLNYSKYIKKTIKDNNLCGVVVDAGCGTGTMLKHLNDLTNDLVGVDISSEMLSISQRKNLKALLVQQDITKLSLLGNISLVYSSLDVLNHLSSLTEVKKYFSGVSSILDANGIFIFDFNLPYKHENILANNCFTYEKYKYLLIWNSFLYKDKVKICLDLFTKQSNGLYLRESEEFFEYTYSLEEILKLLENDFELIEVIDGDSFKSLSDSSQRALVSVRKKQV